MNGNSCVNALALAYLKNKLFPLFFAEAKVAAALHARFPAHHTCVALRCVHIVCSLCAHCACARWAHVYDIVSPGVFGSILQNTGARVVFGLR